MVLLLWFVGTAIEAVHGAAWFVRSVCRAAVPGVGVADDGGASGAGKEDLLRMDGEGIGKDLLGALAPEMRAGDDARGAIIGSEIVEHEDRVGDPVALFVGDAVHVHVQRLVRFGVWISGADIEAGELVVLAEDVAGGGEDFGDLDGPLEDLAFVDAVGQAACAGFVFELGTGGLAFGLEEFFDAVAEGFELAGGNQVGQDEEAVAIESFFLLGAEHRKRVDM